MSYEGYTYPTSEIQRVPGHRNTEPALQANFEAIRERSKREESLKPDSLTDDQKTEYLDSIRDELKHRSRAFKFQIYEIGKLLYEAKRLLPHGQYKAWIEANFEFSLKTAHNCKSVYRACIGHPETVEYFNPSCLYLLAEPSFPGDLREALFDNASGPVDVNKKELVQLAIKYKNGEIGIQDEEVQQLLKKQRDSTVWEKYKIELEALQRLIDSRLDRIKRLSKIHYSANPLIKPSDDEDLQREDEQGEIENKIEKFKAEINVMIEQLEEKCK